MALQKIMFSSFSQLYLWKITESLSDLLAMFNGNLPLGYLKYKYSMHQKQFLAKELLFNFLQIQGQVQYLPNGKPILNDGRYLSVSHTSDWVGVVLSNIPIGLDMELPHNKLLKVKSKFQHEKERHVFDQPTVENCQYLWTAKESIYKLIGKKQLSFKEDIRLLEIDKVMSKGLALVQQKTNILLYFNKTSSNVLISQAIYQ